MTTEETSIQESIPPPSNPQTNNNSNPQESTGGGKNSLDLLKSENKNVSIRHVDMKVALGTEPSIKIPPTAKDDRKLFVGGLPSDVTDQEFRTFFEQFGSVLDSVVMYDRETRNSRGFGFVTFVDPDVSKSLLQKGNHADGIGRLNMRGKTCEVKRAEPKHPGRPGEKKFRQQTSSQAMYAHEAYAGSNNMPAYQVSAGFSDYMAPMYYPFPPPLMSPPHEMVPPPTYYMGNYPDPMALYPMPPSNPQPFAFFPVMTLAPPPTVLSPQQASKKSVMQPVAPGLKGKPMNDDTTMIV